MNMNAIEEAIHRYVNERMDKGKKQATERFLAYAYMKFCGEELLEFMKKVGGISRYYMDFLSVMKNPFKGPEFAWLMSLFILGVIGCMLVSDPDSRNLGIFTLTGVIVNGWTLLSTLFKKWLKLSVLIAIYRELAEISDTEAHSIN